MFNDYDEEVVKHKNLCIHDIKLSMLSQYIIKLYMQKTSTEQNSCPINSFFITVLKCFLVTRFLWDLVIFFLWIKFTYSFLFLINIKN